MFVRKKDRLTVAEREKQAEKERIAEVEAKRAAEDRKRYSIKVSLSAQPDTCFTCNTLAIQPTDGGG